jgi:hypothetical protein
MNFENNQQSNLLIHTSFNLVNCSVFCVFSVNGKKKLDEVDDDKGAFSTTTSGVELKIGGP